MRRFVFTVLAVATLCAQTPGDFLERARTKLQAMTRRLGNYACIETVTRQYFQSGGKLEFTDRVRFEVTIAGNHEILSWQGATRFDERNVDQIIPVGPIGTGAFGTFLIGIFDQPGVTFRNVGEKDGALEYEYNVPREVSRYSVKAGTGWQPMGYEGSFTLDPQSLDLRRLTLWTDESPPGTPLRATDATLDYQSVSVGNGAILLPRQGQLHVVMQDGRETNNVTTFSGCREYQTESELRFDDVPPPAVDNAQTRRALRTSLGLPIGASVTLALTDPIDSDTAAAGDLVSAQVVKHVLRPDSGALLIPAGAIVRGRITRVEHHVFPEAYFRIGISFNRVELNGVSAPFAARLEPDADLARDLGANTPTRGRGAPLWNIGTFLLASKQSRHVFPAGYETKWSTLATPAR